MIENKRGIVNRISYHEAVYSYKNNFIEGLFGVVFGGKGPNKHRVEQPGFGEQNMIWWALFWCLYSVILLGRANSARQRPLSFFRVELEGAVSMNLRPKINKNKAT